MRVRVKFFGIVQDAAGSKGKSLRLPEGSCVADAWRILSGEWKNAAVLPKLMFAVNQEFTKPTATLKDGDELALIPPMSGG